MSTGPLRRLVELVGYVMRRVLLDPIRDGVLRGHRWPAGLTAIVWAGYLLYALATVTVLLAPWLRTRLPLRVGGVNTIPAPMLALVQVVLGFALTALFCAALHLRRWLRPLGWLVVTAVLLIPLNLHHVPSSPELQGPTLWTTLAAPVALGALMVLRWRTRFAWWEFVVTLVVIGTALYAGATVHGVPFENPTYDRTLGNLVLMAALLSLLATPAMLMAGAAFGELTVATAAWTGTALRRLIDTPPDRPAPGRSDGAVRGALGLLLIGLAGLRGLQLATDVTAGGLANRLVGLLGGAWVVLLVAVAMALAIWWADRVSGDFDLRPDPDDIPEAWRANLPWLAMILGVPLVADQVIGQLFAAFGIPAVQGFLDRFNLSSWLGAVTSAAAAVLAVRTARRGLRVAAAAAAAFTAVMTASTINTLFGIPADADAGTVLAVPAVLVIALALLLRGRLTVGRLVTLITVLLLAVAWPYRSWIAEPVSALAFGGISVALMLGLVWRLLTDGGYARHGSPGFPVPARVLLVLGNAFLGLLLVLMLAGFGGNFPYRPDNVEALGDQNLAHTMLIMALCLGCAAALAGRDQAMSAGDTVLR